MPVETVSVRMYIKIYSCIFPTKSIRTTVFPAEIKVELIIKGKMKTK